MNLAKLSFRAAEGHEIAGIVSLVNSAYRGESGKQGWTTEADLLDGQRTDVEEITRLLAVEDSMILLGIWDGEAVASVHLEKHAEGAYLGMLAVKPGLQGRGIGRRVLAAAEQTAQREWRAAKVLMTVITLRHELIDFYLRCGYLRTGRVRPFPVSEKFGIQKVHGLLLEYLEKPIAI
ncbi:MAG: GNAT family N-acetyltransferase [Candidatus Methylumidiphilus sp.]